MALYRNFTRVLTLKDEEYNENFVPYIFLEKIFTENELQAIISLWSEENARQGTVASTKAKLNFDKRKAKELFIPQQDQEWIYDKLESFAIMMNAGRFKLNISGFQGAIRLLQYGEGDFFSWHIDYGSATNSNRKLVICIQLSDEGEYVGGDLQLIHEGISVPRKKGSVVIFPAYLSHRVTPITSGVRYSLVALIGGPPFK